MHTGMAKGEKRKNPAAAALARARARSLTPERRAEIARKAAVTRWSKRPSSAAAS
jgi:hypothetical protein